MGHVLVIGSLNVDLVVRCARMPDVGETVIGESLERHPGGKGLNQAIAAARDEASVQMCGCIGSDDSGAWLREVLDGDRVDDSFVYEVDGSSGTALIEVDNDGRNRIVVVPGANQFLAAEHAVDAVRAQPPGTVVLASLEVPIDAVTAGLIAARERNLITVLNPAPAATLPDELIAATDYLIPNEHEILEITGQEDIDAAIADLRRIGAGMVIVTLGDQGIRWSGPLGDGAARAVDVEAIDTVAAGDSFCGVFASVLADGQGWDGALGRATHAAAITVTRRGAVPSLPRASETNAFIDRLLAQDRQTRA